MSFASVLEKWESEARTIEHTCGACDYSRGSFGSHVCVNPRVTAENAGAPQVIAFARKMGGACGPEAKYLTIDGLQL